MKRRHRTMLLIAIGGTLLLSASLIGAYAMKKTVSFFYSPMDIAQKPPKTGVNIRLGGLVESGSLKHLSNGEINFSITDGQSKVKVIYSGILPNLFREGQGVIAEGSLEKNGQFKAKQILAKHDENYVPKEVADALKKSGQWRGAKEALNQDKQ